MWNFGPRFCSSCGTKLVDRRIEGRNRRFCETCEETVYRNPKPCAGVLVIDERELLLVKRTAPPAIGAWSIPAGYLEVDESFRTAAVRELDEETGVDVPLNAPVLAATNFVEHENGTTVAVVVYAVDASETNGRPTPGSDAADARFWSLERLAASDETIEPGYRPIFKSALATLGRDVTK